jgi:hypothetical protein
MFASISMFSAIPLVIWFVITALAGAGVGVGVVKWDDLIKEKVVKVDGKAAVFKESMNCVLYYYKAIRDKDYKQYSYCVMDPLSKEKFYAKINKYKDKWDNGVLRDPQPVKDRSKEKEKDGYRYVKVRAISPWSGKEVGYDVISQGNTWKIVTEQ